MTDNPEIDVLHLQAHARGTQVAGVDRRLYHVNPVTGVLHAVAGGIVSAQSGCHPDCAARFALFPDTFRRSRPRTPPPPPAALPENGAGADGPAPLPAADLAVLDGSVGRLRAALESGEHDFHLDTLMAAEEAGKTRKSAVAAIRDRLDGLEV